MPSPSRRLPLRAVTGLLLAWLSLGLVPGPALGTPRSEIAQVPVSAEDLIPATSLSARGPLPPGPGAWSRSTRVCAPFRFTMVAVTWRGAEHADAALTWGGGFARAEGEGHEGPDPGSAEDSGVHGTPAIWTGERRCIQLKLRTHDGAAVRAPRMVFLNTSGTARDPSPLAGIGTAVTRALAAVTGWLTPAPAAAWTNQPNILTRARWGADESLRRCGPHYMDEARVAYVHHTATGNGYKKSRADDVVRGIYAYHTNARHFCDIAYNFLIDRWGRIYEGRAGGIDQPVQGGHAMGFNTGSVGIAAIGTFSKVRPRSSMIKAFRRLIRWRLDVAHRDPKGWAWMTSAGGSNQRYDAGETVLMRSVVPHRRTGYTDCPGNRLIRAIKGIRNKAGRYGHPKIYLPTQSADELVISEASEVAWSAQVSLGSASWYVDVTNALGELARRFPGSGQAVAATWDGTDENGVPVPDGDYQVQITASAEGSAARPAAFTVRVCSIPEPGTASCPEPVPEPEP